MKTPREILFKRHRAAEPRLDALRKMAVASVRDCRSSDDIGSAPLTDRRFNSWEFLCSLRWHLAGMSAVWFVVVLLNVSTGRSPTQSAAIPGDKIPPPQVIVASLCENRRQLVEMIQPLESRDAEPAKPRLPGPRSERRSETLAA